MRLWNRLVEFGVGYRDWLHFHETFSKSPNWKIENSDRKFNRNLCIKIPFNFFNWFYVLVWTFVLFHQINYIRRQNVSVVQPIIINPVSKRTYAIYFYLYANDWARFKFQFDLIAHSGREREKKDLKLGLTEPMLTNGNIHRWNDQATDRPTDPYKHICT